MEPWQPEGDPQPESVVGRATRANDGRVTETALRVVDRTRPVSAFGLFDLEQRQASGLPRFALKAWSLPTFSQNYATHQWGGSTTTMALARVLRSLEGKFSIVNRRCTVSLPPDLRRLIEDPHASDEVAQGANWIAFALQEPVNVLVRHATFAARSSDASREVEFSATVPYRLTIFAGQGPMEDAPSAIEEASMTSAPIESDEGAEWFRVGLCLPDADALRQMTEETAHFYRWITGRLGGISKDRYWHLDAWEQYTEEGRFHGVVVPEFLRQERLSPSRPENSVTSHGESYSASRWAPLTRVFDKRPLVPPGYCFIEFTARICVDLRPVL